MGTMRYHVQFSVRMQSGWQCTGVMIVQNRFEWLVRLGGWRFRRREWRDSSRLGRRRGLSLESHARILGEDVISRRSRRFNRRIYIQVNACIWPTRRHILCLNFVPKSWLRVLKYKTQPYPLTLSSDTMSYCMQKCDARRSCSWIWSTPPTFLFMVSPWGLPKTRAQSWT